MQITIRPNETIRLEEGSLVPTRIPARALHGEIYRASIYVNIILNDIRLVGSVTLFAGGPRERSFNLPYYEYDRKTGERIAILCHEFIEANIE